MSLTVLLQRMFCGRTLRWWFRCRILSLHYLNSKIKIKSTISLQNMHLFICTCYFQIPLKISEVAGYKLTWFMFHYADIFRIVLFKDCFVRGSYAEAASSCFYEASFVARDVRRASRGSSRHLMARTSNVSLVFLNKITDYQAKIFYIVQF